MTPERSIENLIATYAFLVDDGDFAGLAELLVDARFTLNGTTVERGGIESFARQTLQVHHDGTPRTRHVTTNLIIEVDENGSLATARSYYTVFQALSDFPLQPIASGRYRDRFEKRNGKWCFVERDVTTYLVGDLSRHVRAGAPSKRG